MNVSSYDICVQGYERLRCETEILLPVCVDRESTAKTIASALEDEIQCCMRDDGAYEALRQAVALWLAEQGADVVAQCAKLEASDGNEEEDDDFNPCMLFVYVETGSDQPVYQF